MTRRDEWDGTRGYFVHLGITSEMPEDFYEASELVRLLSEDFWKNPPGILDALGVDWRADDPPVEGENICWELAVCFWDEDKGEPKPVRVPSPVAWGDLEGWTVGHG